MTELTNAERIVAALTAALPMAGEATSSIASSGGGGIPVPTTGFVFRAQGWPGAVVIAMDTQAVLPDLVASDPAAALTPAVESALSTVGASSGVTAEITTNPFDGLGDVHLITVAGAPSLYVAVQEGQRFPAPSKNSNIDEDFLRNAHRIRGVDMDLSVVIGRTTLTVAELLRIKPGQVLELDRAAGAPADVLVNGRHLASGEVVVQDLDFAVKITSIRDDNDETGA